MKWERQFLRKIYIGIKESIMENVIISFNKMTYKARSTRVTGKIQQLGFSQVLGLSYWGRLLGVQNTRKSVTSHEPLNYIAFDKKNVTYPISFNSRNIMKIIYKC